VVRYRNPEQERNDALRHRAHVMERRWAEFDDAERDSSLFVGAFEITLGNHLVMLNDEHRMHIWDVAGTQTPLEGIKCDAIRMIRNHSGNENGVKNTGEPRICKNESRGK